MKRLVGKISEKIIKILQLNIAADTPIYIGDSNITHMKKSHPADYEQYGADITTILDRPDYVGINPHDDSIEYVREYRIDNKHVKVAVRVSLQGTYYARSLYVLNSSRVVNFIQKGTLKKVPRKNYKRKPLRTSVYKKS